MARTCRSGSLAFYGPDVDVISDNPQWGISVRCIKDSD